MSLNSRPENNQKEKQRVPIERHPRSEAIDLAPRSEIELQRPETLLERGPRARNLSLARRGPRREAIRLHHPPPILPGVSRQTASRGPLADHLLCSQCFQIPTDTGGRDAPYLSNRRALRGITRPDRRCTSGRFLTELLLGIQSVTSWIAIRGPVGC